MMRNRKSVVSAFMLRLLRALCAAALLGAVAPALAQQVYPTPEAAMDALGDGVARSDPAALTRVLGAQYPKAAAASSRPAGRLRLSRRLGEPPCHPQGRRRHRQRRSR
jgi:hypothetical protein